MATNLEIYQLHVANAPQCFIVDKKYVGQLVSLHWKFIPKMQRARATVKPKVLRVFLHRYIAQLAGITWLEIFFANNDPFDCRVENLRPYRREEEGARRATFKNKTIPFKGVYLKKGAKKNRYGALIRVKGKLKHLGYFDTPELAAAAYAEAFKLAHP